MMFYDVLCLKSILGFLLLERTSGFSPEIFLIAISSPSRTSGRSSETVDLWGKILSIQDMTRRKQEQQKEKNINVPM